MISKQDIHPHLAIVGDIIALYDAVLDIVQLNPCISCTWSAIGYLEARDCDIIHSYLNYMADTAAVKLRLGKWLPKYLHWYW